MNKRVFLGTLVSLPFCALGQTSVVGHIALLNELVKAMGAAGEAGLK